MKITTNLVPSGFYNESIGGVVYPTEEYSDEELSLLPVEQQLFIKSDAYGKTLPEVPLQFWFDITSEPDVIWFKFINLALNSTVFNLKLDYNLIKNNANYDDQTMWTLFDNFKLDHDNHIKNSDDPYIVSADKILSLLSQTYVSKEKQFSKKYINANYLPFKIFVPYKNCPLNEVIFYVAKPAISNDYRKVPISFTGPDGSTATITSTSITEENAQLTPGSPGHKAGWLDLISDITVQTDSTTVNVGDTVVVNITTENTNISTVYLEPVIGTVNKTRVRLTNGQGSFIVKTDDLEAGDEIRIKLGYKFFTGAAEFVKVVT
jgi:hypothetical protein